MRSTSGRAPTASRWPPASTLGSRPASCPWRNMGRARARQALVLERIVTLGMITPPQAEEAQRQPITLKPPSAGLIGIRAPYFVSFILPQLLDRFGEEVV